MTNYTKLSGKPNEFIAMTGLSVDEFNSLLFYFKKAEGESKFTIAGKERRNKHTVYNNSPIKCSADRLLFILIYMKQYMTQTAIGQLFGISQPKANMFIHYLTPLLSAALNESGSAPCRNMENINEYKSDVYCHDGTERHINRPKNKGRQKECYSGKKRPVPSKTI